MTETPPQRRRRTRPTVEPSDYQPPADDRDDDDEFGAVAHLSRQQRRRNERRRRSRGAKKIVIDAVEYDPITVEFVGREYDIIPPRMDTILKMGDGDGDGAEVLDEWIREAFGGDEDEGQAAEIFERIDAPRKQDPAGYDEIRELIQAVTTYVGKNPPTS